MADRTGATYAAIVGERELEAGVVTLRRLSDGDQQEIAPGSLAEAIAPTPRDGPVGGTG